MSVIMAVPGVLIKVLVVNKDGKKAQKTDSDESIASKLCVTDAFISSFECVFVFFLLFNQILPKGFLKKERKSLELNLRKCRKLSF